MGGGEHTDSSQATNRPLTAAERQDLYRSSIGNILNTYQQSGLPYGGTGSMSNATNATFNPNAPASTGGGSSGSGWAPSSSLFNASGTSHNYDKGGQVTLDPKTYFQAPNPDVKMPTGTKDPGGINMPVYQTPQYQAPGTFQKPDSYQQPGAFQQATYQGPGGFQSGGYTAGLDYAKGKDTTALNNDMAKRGIWSSGLAESATNDLNASYAPAYEKAGADQAAAQNSFNQTNAAGQNTFNQNNAAGANAFNQVNAAGVNSFNQANAAGANAFNTGAAQNANNFNVTNASNSFQAGWQPLDYLQKMWNGTSGQTSGSSSFGQGLNFSV